MPGVPLDTLAAELPGWLPSQRWFAGKDRPVTAARPVSSTVLGDGLAHVVVEVDQDGRAEPYQLLVAWDERGWREAVGEPGAARRLLELMASGERVGQLTFAHEPGVELDTAPSARPVTTEQSNTSLVYGQLYILKLFRRLTPGINLDLRTHRALREVGCAHVAEPLGSITGRLGGDPATVGMLQRFVPGAVDGWTLATTRPGAGFPAAGLGRAVADVHVDLRRAFAAYPDITGDRLADAMRARLETVAARVPDLAARAPALRAAFDAIRGRRVPTQRIHGDLHLGQVLYAHGGWLLIDFEGEPAAPAGEREASHSSLRDVAGMLRSFDYAASVLGTDWARRHRTAFCDGYAEVTDDPREHGVLLRAFELDKAVYEVAYEHGNRPGWLQVPLSSIATMTETQE